jgi:hypothetical protein
MEHEETPPRSGTISVTWAECPNVDCDSRAWTTWDVDYYADKFKCGTCQARLGRPIFAGPIKPKG